MEERGRPFWGCLAVSTLCRLRLAEKSQWGCEPGAHCDMLHPSQMSPEKQVRISGGGGRRARNDTDSAAASVNQCGGSQHPVAGKLGALRAGRQAGRVTWRSPRPAHNPPAPSLSGSRTSLLAPSQDERRITWQADCLLIIYHIPESWCSSPNPKPAENKTCPALDRASWACEVRLPDLGWHLWASEQTTMKAICSQATYSLFPKTEQNKT